MTSAVKIEAALGADALRILRDIPGMTVAAREPGEPDRGIDAIIHFAGTDAQVAVEFKQRANAATAWQLAEYARALPDTPLLLIAEETTAEARAILGEHGIGVVDGFGNAHIELPGLLLHYEGRRLPRRGAGKRAPTRLRGKAGVAAQALLLDPQRAWGVTDLANEAQVSAGLAHRVLARLEAEGIVAVEGTGPNRVRHVTNPTALLDLWAEETVESPLRTLGHLLAQTPQQLIERLGNNLDASGIAYALTGAGAASIVAPFVTAVPVVEVWAKATAAPEELSQAAQIERVTEGQNVVVLQAKDDGPLAFREKTNGVWLANRFRLYADLRRDPRRGREQADHLRQEVIGF